jgi:hypothetical protein
MFLVLYPAYIYTNIAAGVILLIAAPYVIRMIWKGSKSLFAYALMAFTLIDGAQFFAFFCIQTIRHPIIVGDQTIYAVN